MWRTVFVLILCCGVLQAQHVVTSNPYDARRLHVNDSAASVYLLPQQTQSAPQQIQSKQSQYGYAHTPKGNLHMLIIYVGFNRTSSVDDVGEPYAWRHDTIPAYAMRENNMMINSSPGQPGPPHNLTRWFSTMSAGNFTITGDVYWVVIDPVGERGSYNFFAMYPRVFEALEKKYPDMDWGKYDQRQNVPAWEFDNSKVNRDGTKAHGDGVIDYVLINFRNLGYLGMGVSDAYLFGGNKITTSFGGGKTYQCATGHTTEYMSADWEHHHQYFRHEFAHVLFSAPHYFGANNLPGRHFYTNIGWGMMGAQHQPMNTVNAWEKWYLGWNKPQEITANGTYLLHDFLCKNDAMRIRIPDTDQYLWLENHLKKDSLDDKLFYKKESPMGKGIYAYVSARGNDSKKPDDFGVGDNRNTNNFKILSAAGNRDYGWRDTVPYRAFYSGEENPIAGQTQLTLIRKNYDSADHAIALNTDWNHALTRNDQDGVLLLDGRLSYPWSGSEKDAFGVGYEIGLSGIVPALNYPFYNEREAVLDTFFLNGLSIKVAGYDSLQDAYKLVVRFDDFEVRKNKRWCGTIALNNLSKDAKPDLVVKPAVVLTIDKSGTPNTHVTEMNHEMFPDFIRPTSFTITEGATLQAGSLSKIVVDDSSSVILKKKSALLLKTGASLVCKNKSQLRWAEGGRIHLDRQASIVFEAEGISIHNIEGKLFMKSETGRRMLGGNIRTALLRAGVKL